MTDSFASRALFDEALGHISAGRLARAEAICRRVIGRDPKDINMLALLGAVLLKRRQFNEAEEVLKRSIKLAPTFAKPHEDLGFLLLRRKRPREAVEYLRTAVKLDPKLELAHFNLGKALAMLGEGNAADEAFEASFALAPHKKTLALANEHYRHGRYEEAERLCREVLRERRRNVDAMRLLAAVAASASRLDEAERLFQKTIELAPDFTGAILDLGRVLKEQERYEEAIECFRRAIRLEPGNAKAHFLLGSTLAPAALNYDAIEAYQRCLEIRPDHAGAMLGLGHMLKTVGRQEEAIQCYRDCIRLKPDNGEIYWSLANLKTYRFSDEEIDEMRSRLESGSLTAVSEVNFLFALAKAYEDRSDFEQAWELYHQGNTKRRMQERYDPVQTEVQHDAIIEIFDKGFLDGHAGAGNPDPAPIFVVGLPRSGSTLIEQILASHSQVEGTSELPYLSRVATSLNRNRVDGINYPRAVRELAAEHFRALGEDYLNFTRLHRTEGTPYFIDKMPNNFPHIGFMHLILPGAKIVDARRHPLDACLSCYRQLFARGQTFTYDLMDIGEYYLQYHRMMDHWHEVMPGRVLTVQYEEMVTDFENQVRRLIDYCGLPWEDACLRYYDTDRPIRTASSEQVRQPVYGGSIGFWRRYENHLSALKDVLAPVLPRYEKYTSAGT